MWHMVIPVWLQLLVYALAVARVTGLVYADTITEPLRDWLLAWLDDRPATLGSFVASLIQCPWCVSIWLGAVAAPLVWFWGDNPVMLILGLWLALSQFTGMTHNLGR
jgi:uncharacterized protein DUF1360